ncbi:type IV pilus twitching motility protein PilT [Virgibacillus xinjiangensis]|uniref:Type IV pilus twitching motility protein PilT n=1 Tax=Virgibacillus xinjiangensis TaxID=393090 RepID=A0ABV7CUT7_9BACI
MIQQFAQLLTDAVEKQASDIHMTVGRAPVFRIHGRLREQEEQAMDPAFIRQMVEDVLAEEQLEKLKEQRELDFSYDIPGVSRFRINVYHQRGNLALAVRVIPASIPSLEELRLPAVLKDVIQDTQGLILVTGPTGSGKSTTLASLVDYMNRTQEKHIITLEDPIEYMHGHQRSVIDQREIGSDTMSFAGGLRASLRQDPDVILVGEMRDLETISTAITAAETGHLVLGTLHTTDAVSTIERVIDVFPPSQQAQIRIQLSTVLKAVVSQRLLLNQVGSGRRAATEILINTSAVKNLIRNEKMHQMQNVLQTSRGQGMHTLEMDVQKLLQQKEVGYDSAVPYLREGARGR